VTVSGGFTANPRGIKGLAGFANDHAEDVRRVVSSLQGLPGANEDSLGDSGVLNAYTSFFETWTDELNIIASSLEEISRKFTDTADHYHANDVRWSHNFQSIDP
jgi:hypothetical protein